MPSPVTAAITMKPKQRLTMINSFCGGPRPLAAGFGTGNDGASVRGATLVVVSAMASSGWGITLTGAGKCGHDAVCRACLQRRERDIKQRL
jgi:hypothetical protein